jgi:hypothetical protein
MGSQVLFPLQAFQEGWEELVTAIAAMYNIIIRAEEGR